MRPLFLEFPDDGACLRRSRIEYLFGPDLLVAPVLDAGARSRAVYLPDGAEVDRRMDRRDARGRRRPIEVDAPLERIPLFLRDGARLPITGEP